MLKRIPREGPGTVNQIRQVQKKKIKKAHKVKSAKIVQQKKHVEMEKENGILKSVCFNLIKFIKKNPIHIKK